MPKRKEPPITLGSGKVYLMEFDGEMPEVDAICVDTNELGYIKGGAALEYTEETSVETDDLGRKSKTITTSEEVLMKLGLITWNGNTLQKLIDRCQVSETEGKRVTKIGGAGNAQGKNYVICFFHEDKQDGNLWALIKGRNTAGASLSFATDAASVVEPEFRAEPHDDAGTLVELIEEIGETA